MDFGVDMDFEGLWLPEFFDKLTSLIVRHVSTFKFLDRGFSFGV